MSFYTHVDGKFMELEHMDEACEKFLANVKYLYNREKERNDRLQEENKKLRDEHFKDEQLQQITAKYEEAREDLYRGFPISRSEWEKVQAWQKQHDAEKHGLIDSKMRLKAGGAIGGRYHFKFVPTSIGVSGTCVCGKCGEEFEFQELG